MRYLIRKCCNCGMEYGKQPLPENYAKIGIAKYDKGDLVTHGYCDKCAKAANQQLDKIIKERNK